MRRRARHGTHVPAPGAGGRVARAPQWECEPSRAAVVCLVAATIVSRRSELDAVGGPDLDATVITPPPGPRSTTWSSARGSPRRLRNQAPQRPERCPVTDRVAAPAMSSEAPALSSTMSRAAPRAPPNTSLAIRAFSAASPPRSARSGLGEAHVARMDVERVHGAVPVLRHLRVARGRNLIKAVGAVHHPGARRSQKAERSRHELGQLRSRHADELPGSARRIGQRTEQIERRPHAEILPRRSGMTHRRMEGGREEEGDSRLVQAALDDGRSARRCSRPAPRRDRRCHTCSTPSDYRAWRPTPHAATTSAATVDTLNVCARSPPVPQVSKTSA